MIVDGRAIAEDMYASLKGRRDALARPLTLGIVVSGANPVIESFVRIKGRAAARLDIAMERVDLPDGGDTESAEKAVKDFASRVDALIVQLPLLKHLDTEKVLAAIPPEKDVDAINPEIADENRPVGAPVALAVVEVLNRSHVDIAGKRAVVVGEGRLVGAPSAFLLKTFGAEVSIFTRRKGHIDDLKSADIIVCGVGNPAFIKPEHIKEGVAIVDAGASEEGGVIKGDADPACAEKASVFTPVPGGVGPIAVAMIFRNLLDLAQKSKE